MQGWYNKHQALKVLGFSLVVPFRHKSPSVRDELADQIESYH